MFVWMKTTICIFIWQAGVCICLRTFDCAIQQLCSDVFTIDPRIQTPSNVVNPPNPPVPQNPQPTPSTTTCPPGYVSCRNVRCGIAAAQPSFVDGEATMGAYPWQAYLFSVFNNKYIGGGVLIHQYFVLTAAHRVCNESFTNIRVRLGVHDPRGTQYQESAVQYMYMPSSFNIAFLKNDIAILFLAQPMNFNNFVNKICLPNVGEIYDNRDKSLGCIVTGYGQLSFTDFATPNVLKQAHVPITNNALCLQRLGTVLGGEPNAARYLDSTEICAGGESRTDACTLDGGSPLVCPANVQANPKVYSLVGLVIWGKNCGLPGIFGVYLRVQSYLASINDIINCAVSNSYYTACGGGQWNRCCC